MREEIWKDIENYEGLYLVSNTGKVFSNANYNHNGRLKVFSVRKAGYLRVCLSKESINTDFLVHRLVAITFIPNPLNKPCVNHIDGDKTNNNDWNLEWCDHYENNHHARRLGLAVDVKGEEVGTAKLTEKQVLEIRQKAGSNIRRTGHILAKEYNVTFTTIKAIYDRKLWKHI